MELISITDLQIFTDEPIGQGATSIVWKAIWKSRVVVAIKKFKAESNATGSEISQQAIREVSILPELSHMNIIQFYGLTKNGIVMEFINGGSLYSLLHNQGIHLDWPQKIGYTTQVINAVNFLHKQQPPIIHGDIKSFNFLYDKDRNLLKLIDFGLSKLNPSTEIQGTLRWIPPELFEKKIYTTSSDIFSVGMVLYEIATRNLPFHSVRDEKEVMDLIRQGQRPLLPQDCPLNILSIIEGCWSPNPQDWPSLDEISQAITQRTEIKPKPRVLLGRDYTQLSSNGNPKRVYGPDLGWIFGKFLMLEYITIIPKHLFEFKNNNPNSQLITSHSSSSSQQTNTPSQQKQPFSKDDLLVISDSYNSRIVLIEKTSGKVKSIIGSGKQGNKPSELNSPVGTAITFSSTHPNMIILLVADYGNHRIQSFDIETGKYLNHFTDKNYIEKPWGICVSSTTNQIFVANRGSNTITIHTGYPNTNNNNNNNNSHPQFGTLINVIGDYSDGTKFLHCMDVKINSKGNLIVSSNHKIDILGGNNYKLIKSFGSSGNKNGEFNYPYGVCVDELDNVLVCDHGNNRVQIFDREGNWIHTFGFGGSSGIVVDKKSGDIYMVVDATVWYCK